MSSNSQGEPTAYSRQNPTLFTSATILILNHFMIWPIPRLCPGKGGEENSSHWHDFHHLNKASKTMADRKLVFYELY